MAPCDRQPGNWVTREGLLPGTLDGEVVEWSRPGVLLTTYTAAKITEKATWIHACYYKRVLGSGSDPWGPQPVHWGPQAFATPARGLCAMFLSLSSF